jgi:hypothetical protein
LLHPIKIKLMATVKELVSSLKDCGHLKLLGSFRVSRAIAYSICFVGPGGHVGLNIHSTAHATTKNATLPKFLR